MTVTFDSQCDLAALVYRRDQDPDRVLAEFAAALTARGSRAVGLVQASHKLANVPRLTATLLHSGATLPLFQDLGPLSTGCRLDVGRLLEAGSAVARAIEQGADLVVINRFGRQEREGRGLAFLIDQALEADIPVVIAVPVERFSDWIRFADGMSVRLDCDRASLEAWWAALDARPGTARHSSYCEVLK